jgi:hypothetical protein
VPAQAAEAEAARPAWLPALHADLGLPATGRSGRHSSRGARDRLAARKQQQGSGGQGWQQRQDLLPLISEQGASDTLDQGAAGLLAAGGAAPGAPKWSSLHSSWERYWGASSGDAL